MTTQMARAEDGAPTPFRRLSVHEGGLSTEAPRVDALATISCGYRAAPQGDRAGLPRASRRDDPQQIHPHDPQGRAPGLAAALKDGEYRRLLIAFPLDEGFIQQRFARYSASRLEIYGDETELRLIDARDKDNPKHVRVAAGTDEYARLVKTCKADTRIYFCLAEWGENGPEVVFPDGLGFYAIRTTSSHSVRAIESALAYTRQFTRGKIAGLPFVLEVDYREVAGPDGSKRTIPVWTITTRPPQGIRLSSRTFAGIATSALAQGSALMLPAPAAGTWEEAEAEGPLETVDEPSERELRTLQRGGLCDARFYERQWFAAVRGSSLEADAARAAFVDHFSEGRTDSLADYLAEATEEQATALCVAAGSAAAAERTRHATTVNAEKYAAVFGDDDAPPKPMPQAMAVAAAREAMVAAATHGASRLTPADTGDPTDEEHDVTRMGLPKSAPPEEPIKSVRDKRYQDWAKTYQDAIALDVAAEPVTLPFDPAALRERTVRLRERIDDKKAALANPPEAAEADQLPF